MGLKLKEEIAKNLGLGVELAIVILLPIYAGFEADKYFATDPFLFVFSVLVSAGGFMKVINRVQGQYKKELKDIEDERRK